MSLSGVPHVTQTISKSNPAKTDIAAVISSHDYTNSSILISFKTPFTESQSNVLPTFVSILNLSFHKPEFTPQKTGFL